MKKIVVLIALLIFGGLNPRGVAAATVPEVTRNIDYALPYPGILSDSPIYFLKVARDRVVSFLIQSPLKKSFYSLLLSDKRLAGGQMLISSGKGELGATTILNGEEYFAEAVQEGDQAKREKREVGELLAKLTVAATKHEEMITELMPKVSGEAGNKLARALEMSQKSRETVMKVSSSK